MPNRTTKTRPREAALWVTFNEPIDALDWSAGTLRGDYLITYGEHNSPFEYLGVVARITDPETHKLRYWAICYCNDRFKSRLRNEELLESSYQAYLKNQRGEGTDGGE